MKHGDKKQACRCPWLRGNQRRSREVSGGCWARRGRRRRSTCAGLVRPRGRRCSGRGGAACGLYGRHRLRERALLARRSPRRRARWRSPCRRLQAPRCAARPVPLEVGSEARVAIGQPPQPVVPPQHREESRKKTEEKKRAQGAMACVAVGYLDCALSMRATSKISPSTITVNSTATWPFEPRVDSIV